MQRCAQLALPLLANLLSRQLVHSPLSVSDSTLTRAACECTVAAGLCDGICMHLHTGIQTFDFGLGVLKATSRSSFGQNVSPTSKAAASEGPGQHETSR